MPMQIIRADITRVHADAIVNSANRAPTFAKGVDARIYEAAGAELLLTEREKIGYLEVGEACVTPAFALDAKYIFHVSSPRWKDGDHNEVQLLRKCYDKVLSLAAEYHCQSIAIPLLATGNFRFPQGVGLEVATAAIREFLSTHEMDVILVVYNRRSFTLAKEITDEVKAYIDENYVESYSEERLFNIRPTGILAKPNIFSKRVPKQSKCPEPKAAPIFEDLELSEASECLSGEIFEDRAIAGPPSESVSFYLKQDRDFDYGSRKYLPFCDHVIQLMNKKGIEKSSEVYNGCGMSKQTWAKMMRPDHNPSKVTVMLLCIGLKLNLDEAQDLMLQAGYAFSPNKKLDVVVRYCISKKMDIFDTNNVVFEEFGRTLSNCG